MSSTEPPRGPVWSVAGGYCAGKDTLVGVLKERGFREIDVDAVGHRVLEELRDRVAARFGPGILDPRGRVDRRALGERVFADSGRRRELERILHPTMVERVRESVRDMPGPVVINAAILIPLGLDRLCDRVICVTAPLLTRVRRARRRDGLSIRQALQRLWAQRGICLKPTDRPVDIHYVRNAGSREKLEARVLEILEERATRR